MSHDAPATDEFSPPNAARSRSREARKGGCKRNERADCQANDRRRRLRRRRRRRQPRAARRLLRLPLADLVVRELAERRRRRFDVTKPPQRFSLKCRAASAVDDES